MNNINLKNVYYQQHREINEYMDVYLETDMGVLKVYLTDLDYVNALDLHSLNRLDEIDALKKKYGSLYIEEIRRTYDNNIYLLLSGKCILAIEYNLNSNYEHSVQEFRIIESIHDSNKTEFDSFKELEILVLPHSF